LAKLEYIVKAEIENSKQMETLCRQDSRLGFHSEAEGYKYFPGKLVWRAVLLEKLLAEEFPSVRKKINTGDTLFPEYTGEKPDGKIYQCRKALDDATWETLPDGGTRWCSWQDEKNLFFEFRCSAQDTAARPPAKDVIELEIEPCRLWPVKIFRLTRTGEQLTYDYQFNSNAAWTVAVREETGGWRAECVIPFSCFASFHKKNRPLRINVTRNDCSWITRHPLESRLRFGPYNPADLGWLMPEVARNSNPKSDIIMSETIFTKGRSKAHSSLHET
jgi:hypothetical protein